MDRCGRLAVAIMGAIMLLGPRLGLAYAPGETYKQVTVALFTVVFATTAASFSRASDQEILCAIAAYVAVRVVFVSYRGKEKKCTS